MVDVLPTGLFQKWIGCVVANPPRRWWSSTSTMASRSAPRTAWVISLWSTRMSWRGMSFRKSDFDRMPTSRRPASSTGKANAEDSAARTRAVSSGVSGLKAVNSRSSMEWTRTAPRAWSTVVAVSCGERSSVTPAAAAIARISGRNGSPPVATMARTRRAMARRWMPSRSPANTTTFPAGMCSSRAENDASFIAATIRM